MVRNTKRRKGQLRNLNRIVRVRHNKIHHMIQRVANQLGCPYQLVFEEFLEYIGEGHTFGLNSEDIVVRRLLEKYTYQD